MVTDRSTTAGLVVHLAQIYPPSWTLAWQLLIALDLSSHYMHMYSSLSSGSQSHKAVSQSDSLILYYYYNVRQVLFLVCAFNELFYLVLYLNHYKLVDAFWGRVCLGVTGPVWALKQGINVVQLVRASVVLATIDAKEKSK
jgi:CDP-diacylglycerol--inositol 3-phosphatidyltransferase